MLYPMANMAVRANSMKHLECRFAAEVQYLEAPYFIGPKIMPQRNFTPLPVRFFGMSGVYVPSFLAR
jgi:hypothetical protein